MIIFPAVDVKDGQCVRLVKGEFSTVHTVAKSIDAAVNNFADQGAVWVHMVDLDGAGTGHQKNVQLMTETVMKTQLKVQIGGGIRTIRAIEQLMEIGVERVVLGSAAIENPQLVRTATKRYRLHVAVGIDSYKRKVATQGWVKRNNIDFIDLAKMMEEIGVEYIIFTDIQKDGTLAGPSLDLLDELARSVTCKIIASGGIKTANDIRNLKSIGMHGAICGKSLYAGTLDLTEAIGIGGNQYAG